MAYKPMNEIIENIKDTVDILEIIKPVYNFKASEVWVAMDIFDRIFEHNEKLEEADRLWHELQEIEQLIKECEDSDKLEKLKIKKINLDRKLNECFGR